MLPSLTTKILVMVVSAICSFVFNTTASFHFCFCMQSGHYIRQVIIMLDVTEYIATLFTSSKIPSTRPLLLLISSLAKPTGFQLYNLVDDWSGSYNPPFPLYNCKPQPCRFCKLIFVDRAIISSVSFSGVKCFGISN